MNVVENKQPKILIIEDESAIAKALDLKLENEGFSPVIAITGDLAIKESNTTKYDFIIMDLVMPGANGFSILECIKSSSSKNTKTPVIILTNLAQEEDREKAMAFGVLEYFVKADTSLSKVIDFIKTALKNGQKRPKD